MAGNLSRYCFYISGKFIQFTPVTLVPYEPNLIDFTRMNPTQIRWYNDYNQMIKEKVVPRLWEDGDDRAIKWVSERILPVDPFISFKKEL